MTISQIEVVVDLLNTFPSKDGVSDNLIPSTIMEVRTEVYMAHKKIALGSYAMVNISTTNTTKIRCVPDTVLKASSNQVGYYSMNAFTRKQMHIYNW